MRVQRVRQGRLEGVIHFRDRSETVLRVLGRGAQDDPLHRLGDVRPDLPWARQRLVGLLDQDRHRRLSIEGKLAGRHLEQDDP